MLTRRTGGGAKPPRLGNEAGVGGAMVGGVAVLFAVEFRREENMFLAEDTSTSPNFFCGTSFWVSTCWELSEPEMEGTRRGGAGGGGLLPLLWFWLRKAAAAAATRPTELPMSGLLF